jgi:hypothetical protein
MKKLILIVSFLVSTFSFSQEYLPMLEADNAWGAKTFDLYEPTIYYQFNLGEEVNTNNETYKRIYLDGNPLECLIREENGVVYHIDSNNIEKVLLDFTLEVGDTFDRNPISCFIGAYTETTVLSISYEIIAGENRKVLEMEGFFDSEYWIEGIGSTNGGLYSGIEGIEGGSYLTCFYHNDETFFFNNQTECNIILSSNDFKENEIKLFPNPIRNISILKLTSNAEINSIKIYTISGRLIKEEKINTNDYILNNMEFGSGVYFYQVFSEDKLIKTEKFIVN